MNKVAIIRRCRKNDLDDRPLSEQRWCLYSVKDPGKLLGRHPTQESAKKQEVAIQINKGGKFYLLANLFQGGLTP